MIPFSRRFGTYTYVHPLSDVVLTELRRLEPHWFSSSQVTLKQDGSFRVPMNLTTGEGFLETLYDPSTKSHVLAVDAGDLSGQVVLFDGSKQAWQTRLDVAEIQQNVSELCLKLDGES
jgi:hypothetical protein